jgi:hypothetical protein
MLLRDKVKPINIQKPFMFPPPCDEKFGANSFRQEKGFATLLAVLFIFAIGVSIAIFSLALATGSSRFALDIKRSKDAQSLADLCAESAIQKIKADPYFTGMENLSFSEGDCSYTITSEVVDAAIDWQVDSSGTAASATRKVRLVLSGTIPPEPNLPVPNLDSWREVASFD